MNISKLKVGMKLNSYKDLCSILGVKISGGNAKNKQMQEFKKYFDWEKDKYAFIITKIYNKPKAFTENEMIELLILHILVSSKSDNGYSIVATKRKIFQQLNMVNVNFRHCLQNPNQVAIFKNIDEDVVIDVMTSIDKSLDNKLKYAIKQLEDKKILISTDIHMICYTDEYKDNLDGKNVHRIASDKEVSECLEVEHEVLKQLKCKEYKDVRIRKLEKQYMSKRQQMLEEIWVDSFYRAIKIIFLKDEVPKLLSDYLYKYKLSEKNNAKYKATVNGNIQIQTRKNAKNRHENAKLLLVGKEEKIKEDKELIQKQDDDFKGLLNDENMDDELKSMVMQWVDNSEKMNDDDDENGYVDEYTSKEEYYEALRVEREYQKELDKLKKLDMRANPEYMIHVDTIIKLIIDSSTKSLIQDIEKTMREYKKNNKVCQKK